MCICIALQDLQALAARQLFAARPHGDAFVRATQSKRERECVCVRTRVCRYMYVYIRIYTCVFVCARAHTHLHILTHTHTHTPVGENRCGRVGKAEAADKLRGNGSDLGFLQ